VPQQKHIRSYLHQLNQLFNGGNWLDESYTGKLQDMNSTQAFKRPATGLFSVAEIVWHCIYWRQVFIHFAEADPGYRDRTIESDNFRSVKQLRQTGWPGLLEQLKNSQQKIEQILISKSDNFLKEEYKPKHSFQYLLDGLVQHDAYHLGQIGLVLKMHRLAAKK
jgi:uncharacterized damage-inducible protein DinB